MSEHDSFLLDAWMWSEPESWRISQQPQQKKEAFFLQPFLRGRAKQQKKRAILRKRRIGHSSGAHRWRQCIQTYITAMPEHGQNSRGSHIFKKLPHKSRKVDGNQPKEVFFVIFTLKYYYSCTNCAADTPKTTLHQTSLVQNPQTLLVVQTDVWKVIYALYRPVDIKWTLRDPKRGLQSSLRPWTLSLWASEKASVARAAVWRG